MYLPGFSVFFWKSVDGKQQEPHSIVRWAIDFQNDWAARADWCVNSYAHANPPPEITMENGCDVAASSGTALSRVAHTIDRDGDQLAYRWWYHQRPSTCRSTISIDGADSAHATLVVPQDAQAGETIHVICQVTDAGHPPLTRYERVIVTCRQD